MPIDPAGTTPGLQPTVENPTQFHLKCKNPNCDSILAIEIKIATNSGGHRMYQCVKCKGTKTIGVGGNFDL